MGSGGSQSAAFKPLPNSKVSLFNQRVQLKDSATGTPLSGMPYFIRLAGGTVYHGTTDVEGYTDIAHNDSKESAKVFVGHEALKQIAVFGGGYE